MAPPIEYEINLLPKTAATIQKPQFGSLYNLKLELIENKKKLSRFLPPIPEWNRIKPSDIKASSKPNDIKAPSKPSDTAKVPSKPSEAPKKIVKEIPKKVSPDPPPQKPKKVLEESEPEDSEEDPEDAGSEEGSDEEDSGSEEGSDEEDSGSEEGSDDDSDAGETGSEDEGLEVSKEAVQEEKREKKMTDDEMIKMGYTENIPPEELEKKEKERYLKSYKLLSLRLRQKYETTQDKRVKEKLDRMIPLTINDPLELIKNTYDDNIFELQVISSTQRYKTVAAIGFSVTEWLGKKYDVELFDKFASFHLSNMDAYEEVLMELGESSNILSEMTPLQKLMWMFGTNTAMFLIAKMSGSGSAALDVLSMVTGVKVATPKAAPKIRLD